MRFYPTGFGKTRPRLFAESEKVAALKDVAALEAFIAGRASQGGGGSRHAARKKSSKGKFVARAQVRPVRPRRHFESGGVSASIMESEPSWLGFYYFLHSSKTLSTCEFLLIVVCACSVRVLLWVGGLWVVRLHQF